MQEISLDKGKVALVDDEDYQKLAQFRWHAYTRRRNIFHARRTSSAKRGSRRSIYMARVVTKATPDDKVYHKNGNGLDNRKANLAVCLSTKYIDPALKAWYINVSSKR